MWYHPEVVGFQPAGHNLVDEKKTVFLSPLVFDERIHESEWTCSRGCRAQDVLLENLECLSFS